MTNKVKGHALYLMGSKIRLKGLVFLLKSFELIEFAVSEVLTLQHLLLSCGP